MLGDFIRSLLIWGQLLDWLWRTLAKVLCGYGERPGRVIVWILAMFVGLAAVYFVGSALPRRSFLECLYFSAVSLTSLGYGGWVPTPDGWARALGAFESFAGYSLLALFIVSFTNRMRR